MRVAAPVACVAQPMGEWVVGMVAVHTDRASNLMDYINDSKKGAKKEH